METCNPACTDLPLNSDHTITIEKLGQSDLVYWVQRSSWKMLSLAVLPAELHIPWAVCLCSRLCSMQLLSLLNNTRSSAIAKSTARPSCLGGVLSHIYRAQESRYADSL